MARGKPLLYALGRPPLDNDFEQQWRTWREHLENRILDTHQCLLPYMKENFRDLFSVNIDWDTKIRLVGHSFGAAECVELANRYPEVYGRYLSRLFNLLF
jgi:hypothetical protein